MASPLTDADIDNLVESYQSGVPVKQILQDADIHATTLYRILRLRGIPKRGPSLLRSTRVSIPDDMVVERYIAGESEQSISLSLGVARSTIRRRLTGAGVDIRSGHEAQTLRNGRLTPEQRKRNAAAANAASRGRKATIQEREQFARTAERTLQQMRNGEIELACKLSGRNLFADLQVACGPYNIDLAFPPVAVEVHIASAHPMSRAHQRKRVEHLTDSGWRTLYVWRSPSRKVNGYTDLAVDKIVAHIEMAERDPSAVSEYRVIRSTGEDAT